MSRCACTKWLPACNYECLLAHLIGQCYSCMYVALNCFQKWSNLLHFWKQWSRLLHAGWSWRHAGSCGLIPSLLMGLLLALLLLRTYIPSDLSVESFFLGFDVSFSVLAPCPKEAVFVNIYMFGHGATLMTRNYEAALYIFWWHCASSSSEHVPPSGFSIYIKRGHEFLLTCMHTLTFWQIEPVIPIVIPMMSLLLVGS